MSEPFDMGAARALVERIPVGYTPGPLVAIATGDSDYRDEIFTEDDQSVAYVTRGFPPRPESEADANAALYALSPELATALQSALAEIERLHARLEDDHVFWINPADPDGAMIREEVEPGSIPDGIECRDETIRLLDDRIARQAAEIGRLREALGPLARLVVPKRPQGNAGAYSIRHEDIRRAYDLLNPEPSHA